MNYDGINVVIREIKLNGFYEKLLFLKNKFNYYFSFN